MTKNVFKLGFFSLILLGMSSCKNNEQNDLAEQRISELEAYVDSLETVSDEDREANWDQIAADYDRKTTEANDALASLDEETRTTSTVRITTSSTKYDELKASIEAKQTAAAATPASPSQLLRDRLFGAGKIGDDMSFAWVNKDNIAGVYETFFQSYQDNKDGFSREDYDEIKLMYEALDNRKNTVEKEGLSSEDNSKIAGIKFKFGPMFKVNRMGAKARETSEAKE